MTVNLNGPPATLAASSQSASRLSEPSPKRLLHHAGGLAAELHGALAGEALVIAAPHLGAYAGHGADEVLDHAVGIGMIDVEAVEFAVGGQVDARLALRVEDDARGVEARLLAGQRGQPVGNRDSCRRWW